MRQRVFSCQNHALSIFTQVVGSRLLLCLLLELFLLRQYKSNTAIYASASAVDDKFGGDVKTCSEDGVTSDNMADLKAEGTASSDKIIRVLLNGGDNMLGRAIQLTFPAQTEGEEDISDGYTASSYLDISLHPSGKTDLPLSEIRHLNSQGKYLWGDYASIQISPPPDLRILNLETAVTKSIHNDDVPMWKGIRYHFHVDNLQPALREFADVTHDGETKESGEDEVRNSASPVVLSFANNHYMDFGRKAFEEETLPAFAATSSGIFQPVGAGMNFEEASKPAIVDCGDKARVKIFAMATECSGTPQQWGATSNRSGVVQLPGLYNMYAVDKAMGIAKEAIGMHDDEKCSSENNHNDDDGPQNQIRIVSIHWGPNWALKSEDDEELESRREFAHRLIDECNIDLIYGHSSHHIRGMERYKDKLILYGTGDMINDYEGFENRGEEKYNKLGGLYVVDMYADSGRMRQLRIVPMFMNRLRLERYTRSSSIWKPNEKRLHQDSLKSEDLAEFINELTLVDTGGDFYYYDENDHLFVEHYDSDLDIPGGPVLRTKVFEA